MKERENCNKCSSGLNICSIIKISSSAAAVRRLFENTDTEWSISQQRTSSTALSWEWKQIETWEEEVSPTFHGRNHENIFRLQTQRHTVSVCVCALPALILSAPHEDPCDCDIISLPRPPPACLWMMWGGNSCFPALHLSIKFQIQVFYFNRRIVMMYLFTEVETSPRSTQGKVPFIN